MIYSACNDFVSCECGSVLYSISHLVESVLHDPDLLLDNDVLLLAHVHTGQGTEEEERERSEEVERGRKKRGRRTKKTEGREEKRTGVAVILDFMREGSG